MWILILIPFSFLAGFFLGKRKIWLAVDAAQREGFEKGKAFALSNKRHLIRVAYQLGRSRRENESGTV